jgi:hypothetical protein
MIQLIHQRLGGRCRCAELVEDGKQVGMAADQLSGIALAQHLNAARDDVEANLRLAWVGRL